MKKIILVFFLLNSILVRTAILRVPLSYPTIQAAILASSNGDTVLVAPGTYFENINFRGHKIVLTSNYYLAKDTVFICSTVINGSMPLYSDTASCIILNHNEDSTTIIQGFTLTGGKGTKWFDIHGAGTYREGGGILTEFSSPVIRWNRIVNNYVTGNLGGVNGTGGGGIRSGDGHPVIYGNVIEYNQAGYGCGIVINYCKNAEIKNNLITHNSGGQNYGGGGIWATGTNTSSVLIIENNTIANNHVKGGGNYAGKGGGIFVFSIKVNSQNNIIYNNTQSSGNSIAYFLNGMVSADYSDLDFTYSGVGNISVDPQFTDTAFFLLSNSSPCVDAGNPLAVFNDSSIPTTTSAAFPSKGNKRNDMGAYGDSLTTLISHCYMDLTEIKKEKKNSEALIYPNPANGKISVTSSEIFKQDDLIELFNTLGQKLRVIEIIEGKNTQSIDLVGKGLCPGTYIFKIINNDKVFYRKIVLQE